MTGVREDLFRGKRHWLRFIKPRIAKMSQAVERSGKVVSLHSCGDIKEIIPDLIEIGVKILNPFQPEVMDVYEIKKIYGDRLTFYGGMSTQKTLPFSSLRRSKKRNNKIALPHR